MSDKNLSTERKSYLFVVGILLVMSLFSAFFLFYILDSYARIENKGFSLGGATAGFFIIFLLLRDSYFRVTSTERDFEKISTDEKIRSLESQINHLITSKLDNFIVPDGYKAEVSKEFQFGFCYPEDWEFSKFPQQTIYGVARDLISAKKLGFARNINVIIKDISSQEMDLQQMYEVNLSSTLALIPNPKLIFKEDSLFQGLPAMKSRINYISNLGEQLTVYQIYVADKNRKNLFFITFTTTKEDFDSAKVLFDNMTSTFRI